MTAGLYEGAAAALGVSGEPEVDQGFRTDEAIAALTGKGDSRYIPDSAEPKPESESGKTTLLQHAGRFLKNKFGDVEAVGSLASGAAGTAAGAVVGLARGMLPSNYGTQEGTAEAAQRAKE